MPAVDCVVRELCAQWCQELCAQWFEEPFGKAKFEFYRSKLCVVENPNYVVSLAEI